MGTFLINKQSLIPPEGLNQKPCLNANLRTAPALSLTSSRPNFFRLFYQNINLILVQKLLSCNSEIASDGDKGKTNQGKNRKQLFFFFFFLTPRLGRELTQAMRDMPAFPQLQIQTCQAVKASPLPQLPPRVGGYTSVFILHKL